MKNTIIITLLVILDILRKLVNDKFDKLILTILITCIVVIIILNSVKKILKYINRKKSSGQEKAPKS